MKTLCTSKEKNDNMQIEELLKKMNLEDVRKLYVKSMNNELLKKYTFPDHPSSDGYYHLYVKDNSKKSGRRQIKSKSIEELQQKVLDYEKHLSNTNLLTFKEMFLLKCEEKIKYCKDNDKKLSRLNTVGKDKQAYNRYIKDTFFESMLITEIRKENIHDLLFLNCKRYDLKKKAFSSLKSIIKMTLDYAFEEELIPENPYYRVNFEKYNNMIVDSIPIEERAHSDNEIMAIINGLHIIQNENPKYMAAFAVV